MIFQVLLSDLEAGSLGHAFSDETTVKDGAKRINVAFFVDFACVKFDKIDYYLATRVNLAILLQRQVSQFSPKLHLLRGKIGFVSDSSVEFIFVKFVSFHILKANFRGMRVWVSNAVEKVLETHLSEFFVLKEDFIGTEVSVHNSS